MQDYLKAQLEYELRMLLPEAGTAALASLVQAAVDAALTQVARRQAAIETAVARVLDAAPNGYMPRDGMPIDAAPGATLKIASKIRWMGSKVDLVELGYALKANDCLGNATLTDIMATLESTFQVDLPQYHKTYTEIRARKSERTKFLNSLKKRLENHMDDADA